MGICIFSKGMISIGTLRKFKKQFLSKKNALQDNRFKYEIEDIYPCLDDATVVTAFEPHYTYHPAWAARILAKNKPKKHIDISSSLSFVTQVSAFIPVEFYDYRPANLTLPGLTCASANILNLPFTDNSVQSISCMHVIEHIGLGRYGDNFDPTGDKKAIKELKRVLAEGGDLLIVVPIAEYARIDYNAHRNYTYEQISSYFEELKLKSFSLIKDDASFIEHATAEDCKGQKWACGCFHFKK